MTGRKILKLPFGIITHPSETFDRIKTERPFSVGLTIWLLASLIYLVFLYIGMKSFPEWQKFSFSQILLMQPESLWNFVGLFISAFFTNFLAIKLYGCKSDYFSILLCQFFINVITIIFGSLIILFIILNLTQFIFFLNLHLIWMLILTIVAIKRVYSISGSSAFFILLLSALMSGAIFFAFRFLIGLI